MLASCRRLLVNQIVPNFYPARRKRSCGVFCGAYFVTKSLIWLLGVEDRIISKHASVNIRLGS